MFWIFSNKILCDVTCPQMRIMCYSCSLTIFLLGKRTKTTSHLLQEVQVPQIAQSHPVQEVQGA